MLGRGWHQQSFRKLLGLGLQGFRTSEFQLRSVSCAYFVTSCTSEWIFLDTSAGSRSSNIQSLEAGAASLCCLMTVSKQTMMSCSNSSAKVMDCSPRLRKFTCTRMACEGNAKSACDKKWVYLFSAQISPSPYKPQTPKLHRTPKDFIRCPSCDHRINCGVEGIACYAQEQDVVTEQPLFCDGFLPSFTSGYFLFSRPCLSCILLYCRNICWFANLC